MNDILIRALKTFIQAFFGVLIPESCVIFSNTLPVDWTAWKAILIPLICSALSAGISAGWNTFLQSQKNTETK